MKKYKILYNKMIIGLLLFLFSAICYFTTVCIGHEETILISLGLNALNLFWIIGMIEQYVEDKKNE